MTEYDHILLFDLAQNIKVRATKDHGIEFQVGLAVSFSRIVHTGLSN